MASAADAFNQGFPDRLEQVAGQHVPDDAAHRIEYAVKQRAYEIAQSVLEHVDDGYNPPDNGNLFQAVGYVTHDTACTFAKLKKTVIGILDACG